MKNWFWGFIIPLKSFKSKSCGRGFLYTDFLEIPQYEMMLSPRFNLSLAYYNLQNFAEISSILKESKEFMFSISYLYFSALLTRSLLLSTIKTKPGS